MKNPHPFHPIRDYLYRHATAVAASILLALPASAADELNVSTYLGSPSESLLDPIANLMALTPDATGTSTATIDFHGGTWALPGSPGGDNFSVLWEGWFDVTKDGLGVYTFGTASDDGSVVYLDLNDDGDFADSGERIVNNNSFQGDTEATGEVDLQMNSVRMVIGYYQGGGGYDMRAAFKKGAGLGFGALNLINSSTDYFFTEDPYAALAVKLSSPENSVALMSGSTLTASANVKDPGAFTHTVTFHVTPTSPSGPTITMVDSGSPYTADFPSLADGTYEIYASVLNSNAQTAISATRTFTVAPAVTTTIVLDAAGPATTYGQNVTFTATVVPAPTGGTVQFYRGFNFLGSPVPVIAGQASVTTTTLGATTHEITAEYSGFQIYEPSTSDPISQVVGKAPLTVAALNMLRLPNASNPEFVYSLVGFQNGQNLGTSGVTGTPDLSTTAVLASPVGDYPITSAAGTLASDNYNFMTFVDAILTVADVADTFSVSFYNDGGANESQIQSGMPAGFGTWYTPGWSNYGVPFGVGDPMPPVALTSNQSSSAIFTLIDARNGGVTTENPRTTNLGDGNYSLMASLAHGTNEIENPSQKFEMQVTNIPFATYDVIFYMGSSFWNGDRTGKIVFNGAPERAFIIEGGSYGGTFTEMVDGTTPGNYIVYTGVTGSSFTAQVYGDGFNHIGPTGFQIREATPVIAGPVNNAMSTVTATPTAVVANGVSASTVKVALRDANGVRVSNKQVTLANTGGLIPPSALTTNAQGEANFSVSSSTVGTVVFTATVVADSLTLTDTASVEFTDPEAPVAFNVNFHAGTPETGLLGVVGAPGETWNQGTTSVNNLTDATGTVASSVNVTGLPSDGYTVNAALKVFAGNRNFFSKAADTTISITGLVPNTAYDLYIYALSHNEGSWGNFTDTERAAGDFVTSNTVLRSAPSQFLDNGLPGVNGSSFVANGNYVVFQSIVSNNLGNISVLADAYDGLDGNPATSDGDTRLHLSGLQIRPATGVSLDYAAWRSSRYPGLGLPDADDDEDGLSNDYERIFGMNPTDPASSSPYWSGFDPATGVLGYTRRVQSLINMNYKVWYSTDLANWFVDNAAIQTVESVSNDVEFMGVSIDPLLLSQPKLFVRMVATPITGYDPEPSLVNLWGSGNSITLLFSEPMNPSSAANPLNYEVLQTGGGTMGITGATLSSDGGSVTLTLASALGLNTGYTVNLDRLTSATGQALGNNITRQFKTWDDNPNGIKVFILAGQSNMVGFGNVENGNSGAGTIGSLRYLAVNDASYPDYNYASLLTNPSQPTTSAFRTRSDVKLWWRDGGPNLGGTVKKGDLGPPFKGVDIDRIGPEFAFGHVIGDFYPSHNVLIVKTAWGGRSLAADYRPPSAVAARGGRVGDFFSAMIDYTRDALTNLDTEFPEWSGQGYQIVGMGWHQGFNDLINETSAAEYKDNLPDLIKDVRSVFGKPNMPFVIATKGQNPAVETSPYTGYGPVEKAQLWVAGVPKPANVLSTDARPFWRDAAVSPINEGYHWNHNAETYFLLGKSLGDNMVDLLTP